jgi:large subunit ribosomal protein L29
MQAREEQIMKGMKATELKELSAEELDAKLASLKDELFKLRFQQAINQLDNPMRISAVRKDIARIKTIQRDNELNGKSA